MTAILNAPAEALPKVMDACSPGRLGSAPKTFAGLPFFGTAR
jgi:hypothetical protein